MDSRRKGQCYLNVCPSPRCRRKCNWNDENSDISDSDSISSDDDISICYNKCAYVTIHDELMFDKLSNMLPVLEMPDSDVEGKTDGESQDEECNISDVRDNP